MIAGRVAPIAAAVAGSVALVALVACRGDPAPTSDCPAGSATDAARSARVLSLLAVDAVVASRVAEAQPRSCFGSRAPGLGGLVVECGGPAERGCGSDPDDRSARGPAEAAADVPVLLLDAGASDAELAARVAHLVRHTEEVPFLRGDEGDVVACARVVVRAARVEALAARDEAELRRRLGLGPAPREEDVIAGYLARCRDR